MPAEPTVRLARATAGYTVPNGRDAELVDVPLSEALHADIRPLGAAERLLREALGGPFTDGIPDEPDLLQPTRVRVGAVIIRDGMMLLIALAGARTVYEIPGGGVEAGETLTETLCREIVEETGLTATAGRRIARIWRTSRRLPGLFLDHYFLAEASGEIGELADLDLDGGRPVWVPVGDVPGLAVWPRRLRWRIAHWWERGWPENVVELADRNTDLSADCRW
ncbi:NUDIX domain-containing protein [Phytomonospora sp. NPDC050363]|uniref:NUDIX domain-containing protein n=1 Tax=Phytomonospora sp. NPDC050363 TaxID=3155642 RepID=UPI0033DC829B